MSARGAILGSYSNRSPHRDRTLQQHSTKKNVRKMLNVTKTQTLRTQQPHGQEQEQQRETTRNNAKQQYTVIATRREGQ